MGPLLKYFLRKSSQWSPFRTVKINITSWFHWHLPDPISIPGYHLECYGFQQEKMPPFFYEFIEKVDIDAYCKYYVLPLAKANYPEGKTRMCEPRCRSSAKLALLISIYQTSRLGPAKLCSVRYFGVSQQEKFQHHYQYSQSCH